MVKGEETVHSRQESFLGTGDDNMHTAGRAPELDHGSRPHSPAVSVVSIAHSDS